MRYFVGIFFLVQQKLPQIEEHLGKLDTDDPSVIETALENFSDIPYLDQTSVMHRFCIFIYVLELRIDA